MRGSGLSAVLAGAVVIAAALAGPACHVVVTSETTRPGELERIIHRDAAAAQPATIAWTADGRLRFVEPLACPSEDVVHPRTTIERATRANLATFTVGVIATAVGGVMLTSGLFAHDPGGSPYTYVGLAGLAAGLPLAIGPWLGTRTELAEAPASSAPPVRRPGPNQPCGERPVRARAATLAISGGLEIHGAIDGDGRFAVSPYAWTDAFSPPVIGAAITATLDGEGAPRTIAGVLEPSALAQHAAGFLAHAGFDARIAPLRLVPGITAGTLRASTTTTAHGAAIRVVLPIKNAGPGAVSGLRGQLAAPGVPAIDGRMIYIGALGVAGEVAAELVVPITAAAAAALRNATIDLSVELRDAHGTAPATPVRFHGALLGDLTR